jgi:hypothetical protein
LLFFVLESSETDIFFGKIFGNVGPAIAALFLL